MLIRHRLAPVGFIFCFVFVWLFPNSSWAEVGCGSKIGPNQVAFLNKDLECPDEDPALTLEGPNAILDLGGHRVDCVAAPSVGIQVKGTGAILRHGRVRMCKVGIVVGQPGVFGEGNHTITKLRVTDNGTGFEVVSNDNELTNNQSGGHSIDGWIIKGSRNTLENNLSNDNPTGFKVDGNNNTLSKNWAIRNSEFGFMVLGIGNQVLNNLAKNNGILPGNDGFIIEGANSRVLWNKGIGNTGSGLKFSLGSGYILAGNVVYGNQQNGIVLQKGALNSTIFGNFAVRNGDIGLVDDNDDCDNNKWKGNIGTRNQNCIR